MNDFLDANDTNNSILILSNNQTPSNLNKADTNTPSEQQNTEKKKILIKHRKIKKATRTYLYNIDHWATENQIKDIEKQLKKKLATSAQIIKDEDGYALTFNGDHTKIIKGYVMEASKGAISQNCFA